jgi:hypothetical protein
MQREPKSDLLPETVVTMEAVTVPLFSGDVTAATRQGIMVYGNILVGSNSQNVDLVVKANLTPPTFFLVPRPRVIQLQPRQADNNDFGFPDQFALMVIETAIDFIRFRIRRLDANANATGWGQNLRVNALVIDDGTEGPNPA